MTDPSLEDTESYKYKISILLDIIKRYDTYIVSTNAKASLIIAFNSLIMGAVILKFGDIIGFYSTPNMKILVGFLLVTITGSTLLSLFFVFGVVYPFFGNTSEDKKQNTSLIYFGSVSEMSNIEYMDKISNTTLEQFASDLSTQATILARGLKEKMQKMRNSINAITFSIVIIMTLVFLRAAEASS